jgi:hypothetical protein
MIIRRITKPFGERWRKARTDAGRQLKEFTDIFIMWLSISDLNAGKKDSIKSCARRFEPRKAVSAIFRHLLFIANSCYMDFW